MLPSLLVPILLAYSFPAETPIRYQVKVRFEGYIQLFGGKDTDVDVNMLVRAQGAAADSDGNPQVVSEIEEAKIAMNGAELPFDKSALLKFFPKTTISMSPFGRVLKTDAPDKPLPVKLPALHPQRFPDITYLPIEFPPVGVEVGKEFMFKKQFGDSDVTFRVTPKTISDERAEMDVHMEQTYVQFEDRFGNVVPEKDNPATKVATQVSGDGTATFDRKIGVVSKLMMVANAQSKVVNLTSSAESERKLKTTLSVEVK